MWTRLSGFCLVIVALLIASLQLGCYNHTAIQPTELARLTDPALQRHGVGVHVTSTGAHMPVAVVTRPPVLRPDGTTVQFHGNFGVRLTTNSEVLEFKPPVVASAPDGQLAVAGGNRPETRFDLSNVRSVEVSQLSMGRTLALVLAIVLPVVAGVMVGVLVGID